jgi:hypothetical protein
MHLYFIKVSKKKKKNNHGRLPAAAARAPPGSGEDGVHRAVTSLVLLLLARAAIPGFGGAPARRGRPPSQLHGEVNGGCADGATKVCGHASGQAA